MSILSTDSPERRFYDDVMAVIHRIMSKGEPLSADDAKTLDGLARAVERYEKAILPPPFGDAADNGG